jgi:hypothetical protein
MLLLIITWLITKVIVSSNAISAGAAGGFALDANDAASNANVNISTGYYLKIHLLVINLTS